MNLGKLNDWLQFLGMLGVIASLMFVGYQIKQTDDIASSEGIVDSNEMSREFDTLIIENADVWGRGCLGEELSQTDHIVYTRLLKEWFLYKQAAYIRAMADGNEIEVTTQAYTVANTLHRFPAVALLITEGIAIQNTPRTEIAAVFGADIQKAMEALAINEPDPDFSPIYCGL